MPEDNTTSDFLTQSYSPSLHSLLSSILDPSSNAPPPHSLFSIFSSLLLPFQSLQYFYPLASLYFTSSLSPHTPPPNHPAFFGFIPGLFHSSFHLAFFFFYCFLFLKLFSFRFRYLSSIYCLFLSPRLKNYILHNFFCFFYLLENQ